jgi:hypothetical protein
VADSDPPCPWRANEPRESLLIVPAWAGDSEITSPCEERPARRVFTFLPFDVQCWAFDVRRSSHPKEWRTPIRHAHGEPMSRENHFSWSPHGQAIRRSPLLAKSALRVASSLFFRSTFNVGRSTFISSQGVADSDPPCPWRANEPRESLLMVPTWAGDSEITSPCEEIHSPTGLHLWLKPANFRP